MAAAAVSMEIKININVCRVCLKPPVEPVSLFSDQDAGSTTTTSSGHAGGGGAAAAAATGGGGVANMGVLARQFTAVTQLEVSCNADLQGTGLGCPLDR